MKLGFFPVFFPLGTAVDANRLNVEPVITLITKMMIVALCWRLAIDADEIFGSRKSE